MNSMTKTIVCQRTTDS